MSTIKEAVKLSAMLGDYPNTVALKQGKVKSDLVQFDFLKFAEGGVPHDHFKSVVKGEFDFAELALMTVLQAIGYGYPLVALPVALHGRFQHGQIAYNAERGVLKPGDLHGKTVGVRTYSQTTPTWVRGILQNDYGVDLSKVNFVAQIEGHVPEYKEPSNVRRAEKGKKLLQMLLDGEVDAAVLAAEPGSEAEDAGPRPGRRRPGVGQENRGTDGQSHRGRQIVGGEGTSGRGARDLPSAQGEQGGRERAGAEGRHRHPADRLLGQAGAISRWRWNTRGNSASSREQLKVEDLFDATTRALD